MLLSCLHLFVVRRLRSQRDSLPLAVIFPSAVCEPEVNRCLGRAKGVMYSLDRGVWRCRYLCGRTKVRVFMSLVLPVFLFGCETWTLTRDLRRTLNSFGTRSLRKILGHRWSDERLLRDSNEICCLHRERHLQLYGHVARFPDADPAHQILSAREPNEWRRSMGRPRASWLQ